MKAQSPGLTFSQELNYSLAACLIVRPLNQTQQCRPQKSQARGMGVYPLPAEPGGSALTYPWLV
jgi:hypothetical protein